MAKGDVLPRKVIPTIVKQINVLEIMIQYLRHCFNTDIVVSFFLNGFLALIEHMKAFYIFLNYVISTTNHI